MELNSLRAISPIDGRMRDLVVGLDDYFSEFAYIKYRIKIEIEYLVALLEFTEKRKLTNGEKEFLRKIYENFNIKDAEKIKEIEKKTNHDIKAIEYFIKERIEKTSLKGVKEFVHFGLTSDDINNLTYSLMLKNAIQHVYLPTLIELLKKIIELAEKYKETPMLARTHGQPASPTTVGKEFINFCFRLQERMKKLNSMKFPGKLTGAVGNYNALQVTYPKMDWIEFSKDFVSSLGLTPKIITTQILPHDDVSDVFHLMITINNIILNLDRDMWRYISDDYFRQRVKEGEIGSSTMPHKVNPIDFENSEGNLELANAILKILANKLQISRLQRDLSDSTVKRNYGVALAHSILTYKNTLKGLNKISLNLERIKHNLRNHPEIITEGIQTILRLEGYPVPYEKLKKLTRGKKVKLEDIHEFVETLDVPEKIKRELLALTPENYLGLAVKLTEIGIGECKRYI